MDGRKWLRTMRRVVGAVGVHATPTRAGQHHTIATYHRRGQLVGVIAIDEPRQLLDYASQLAVAMHNTALDSVA